MTMHATPPPRAGGWPRLLALLVLAGVPTAAQVPPAGRYCQPVAFTDQRIVIGYKAVVRPAPGCTRPAFVRKVNRVSGSVIGQPALVPVDTPEYVWVFTHRLEYTLDGVHWHRLVVR